MNFDRYKICIRAITPDDAPKLVAGLHDLSEKTRYARFFFFKRAFASDELLSLTHCDGISHGALVAELSDVTDRPLIAVARWIRDAIDPTMTEVAFLTRDDWQRHGIGTALVKKIANVPSKMASLVSEPKSFGRIWQQ